MASTYTVKKGDTLWSIAQEYLGSGAKYKQLAAINNISNPDRIYVGQVIKLEKTSGVVSNKTVNSDSNKAVITHFGLQSNTDNTLFATWSWSKKDTDSYKVLWKYDTGDGEWFIGNESTITVDKDDPHLATQSTYNIPQNALYVQFRVKPISKTYKKNNTDTHYWTAEWSTAETYNNTGAVLTTPAVPKVEIKSYTLTATLDNIAPGAEGIEFQVVKDNSETPFNTGKAKIVSAHASYSCDLATDGEYKVRCRAYKGTLYSQWSNYTENEGVIPPAFLGFKSIGATSETSVYLTWNAYPGAESYDIQYTDKPEHFDFSELTTIKTVSDDEVSKLPNPDDTSSFVCRWIITGLTTGTKYFFRFRIVNKAGEGPWSGYNSIAIGSSPAAPTTWSSTTTAVVGEKIKLYWVHNSEDGSRISHSKLEMDIGGVTVNRTIDHATDDKPDWYIVKTQSAVTNPGYHGGTTNPGSDSVDPDNTPDLGGDDYDKTVCFEIDTAGSEVANVPIKWDEGMEIKWRVSTAGVTNTLGDYSIYRTIDVHAQPTLELSMLDSDDMSVAKPIATLTTFPFWVRGIAGPSTQVPVSYHLSIISNDMYETTDGKGHRKIVNIGDSVYSSYVDGGSSLLVKFWAGNIDLENNVSYTLNCTVAMDSGLTKESSVQFDVAWTDMEYQPNAEIGIDRDTLTAYIRPYCEDGRIATYAVERSGRNYVVTDTELFDVWGEPLAKYKTSTGEQVYSGVDSDNNEVLFCYVEVKEPVTDVWLSVYRREFDGSLKQLASDLDGELNVTISDPHPPLDYARYRVVAVTKSTGAVSHYDLPGYPVGGKAAVIQWDESWTNFEVSENEILDRPPWSGSLLSLPYNIDVSENANPDVSLVKYVGREHPVGYYGTHVGQSSSWSMEIDKADKETLYALRRLQRWMGDVYVREPSGCGYWANITVSFSQKHCETTIPVTLSITRVEGGV